MLYGLIGRKLGHSFSARFFNEKFAKEDIPAKYELFEIPLICDLNILIAEHPDLCGLNVTIPYKTQVLPYLSSLTPTARAIGAVNTVRIVRCKEPMLDTGGDHMWSLEGHNTDAPGFSDALMEFLGDAKLAHPVRALILGTGGASKSVKYALDEMGIESLMVSRSPGEDRVGYDALNEEIFKIHEIIVNCTPLGMWPDVDSCPPIPYDFITQRHFCFDLVYNPEVTEFMKRSAARGARTCNGLQMLINQARLAWDFWQTPIVKKYLSRQIQVHRSDGRVDTYPLAIAEVTYAPDGMPYSLNIIPYDKEIPSVTYLDKPLIFYLNQDSNHATNE